MRQIPIELNYYEQLFKSEDLRRDHIIEAVKSIRLISHPASIQLLTELQERVNKGDADTSGWSYHRAYDKAVQESIATITASLLKDVIE